MEALKRASTAAFHNLHEQETKIQPIAALSSEVTVKKSLQKSVSFVFPVRVKKNGGGGLIPYDPSILKGIIAPKKRA